MGLSRSALKLEDFLDSVLRRDLQNALKKRDDCYNAASHCYHFRQLLADMVDLDEVRNISIDQLTSSTTASSTAARSGSGDSKNKMGGAPPRSEASLATEVTVATSKVVSSAVLSESFERQQLDRDAPVARKSHSSTSSRDPEPTSMLLDLGCHFFTEAEIPNPAVVYINVGCGVVCPMSHTEAKKFLVKKERLLRDESVSLSKEVLRVRFRMRLVMEAINRLAMPQ